MRIRLVLPLLGCLALTGGAAAGGDASPPRDRLPLWTPDGRALVYASGRDSDAVHVVSADGSGDRRLGSVGRRPVLALSPDGTRIAATGVEGTETRLSVLTGGTRRDLGPAAPDSRPAWSPDGTRIAVPRADGIALVEASSGAAAILPGAASDLVAWSSDGRTLAVVSRTRVTLVPVAGGPATTLLELDPNRCCLGPPAWSPDGSRLAVLSTAESRIHLLRADGGPAVPLTLRATGRPGAETVSSPPVWTADGGALLFSTAREDTFALVRLDATTGTTTRLLALTPPGVRPFLGPFGGDVAVSRDGRIAFVHGGECRDRLGVHFVRADGRGLRRLTNGCRILGTARPDRLRGTGQADVLVGLAGADRLTAVTVTRVGDTLLGGSGDDMLTGTPWHDVLDGGQGRDRLAGGVAADLLIGGPGRDTLLGQGGLDVVDAFDGARDTVSCGTNSPNRTPERDVAYADRFDRVSRDCELVLRRKRLS